MFPDIIFPGVASSRQLEEAVKIVKQQLITGERVPEMTEGNARAAKIQLLVGIVGEFFRNNIPTRVDDNSFEGFREDCGGLESFVFGWRQLWDGLSLYNSRRRMSEASDLYNPRAALIGMKYNSIAGVIGDVLSNGERNQRRFGVDHSSMEIAPTYSFD